MVEKLFIGFGDWVGWFRRVVQWLFVGFCRYAEYDPGQTGIRDNPIYKREIDWISPLLHPTQFMENSNSKVCSASSHIPSNAIFKIADFHMVAELLVEMYQFSQFFNLVVRTETFRKKTTKSHTVWLLHPQPFTINKFWIDQWKEHNWLQ